MIIGHGDIAGALKKIAKDPNKKGWIFFASGVSNSGETRESEYQREKNLLMSQSKKAHLVYFSSLCIFYTKSRYAIHKMQMEDLVRFNFKHFTIVRLGNITWGKNPNTLINFFKNEKKSGKKLKIQDTYRYLVGKDEFLHWIGMAPSWNSEMNITGERLKVKDIIKKYV